MPTDNHGLNTPSEGATDWHLPLNENFSSLDSILQNISTDGTTFSPSSMTADEVTLGGETRTSWESFYSTDPTIADDKVIVAETAADIQTALDTLDGTETGYDSDGTASRPGGGAVMLKRKKYAPSSPITLRQGTRLIGAQPDFLLGQNHHEWQYSVISAENLSSGSPMIRSEPDRNHFGVHDVVLNGGGNDVYGIKWEAGSGTSITKNVVVTRTRLPGYWCRGSLDTRVVTSSVKDCGDSSSPAVLIESENDSIGGGSDDTQIRWLGGRISNDKGYSALVHNSSLGRWYDCTIKSSSSPSSTPMPVIDHDGALLELSRCTVDAYRGTGAYGISQSRNNQLRVWDTLIEKGDVAIHLNGNSQTSLDSVRIRDMISAGVYVDTQPGQWNRVDIQDVDDHGVVIDGGKCFSQLSNVRIRNWGGKAVDIRGVKGGQPGEVPVFNNLDIGTGDYASHINNPQLCIVDGEWVRPYTYSLGGSNGTVSISNKPTNPTGIRVTAGSSAATLQGIDGRTAGENVVIVERTGANDLALAHDAAVTHPLLNRSGANEILESPGAAAAYRYDAQTGAWREVWSNTA